MLEEKIKNLIIERYGSIRQFSIGYKLGTNLLIYIIYQYTKNTLGICLGLSKLYGTGV